MKTNVLFAVILLGLAFSCKKENVPPEKEKYNVNGVAQKGPFIQGSQIDISELDELLNQTGINFKSEIKNNLGEFELSDISLLSSKIEMAADGYYFNEISGVLSPSRLVLKSLSDLSDSSKANINLLTHITVDRIRTLYNSGEDFSSAKEKAQNEVLSVFNIDSGFTGRFDDLDIGKQEEQNAILIAISSIFQGRNSVAELSLLLADFIEDFSIDGKIDDTSIRAELENNAKHIDTVSLRMNLESHYSSLGNNLTAPNFEKYLRRYFDGIVPDTTLEVTFPQTGAYGQNILAMVNEQEIDEGTEYSITAQFPSELGLLVRLKINANGNSQVTWVTDEEKKENWFGSLNDGDEILGQKLGGIADMSVVFSDTGEIQVELGIFKDDIVDEYLGSISFNLKVK